MRWLFLLTVPFLLSASASFQPTSEKQSIDDVLNRELPSLVSLYEHLHANPELSTLEVKSAARMAEELRKAGYEVTEKVGGTGVVAVLKNGPGKTLMIRADMDGLPVKENTGLPYASKAVMVDREGIERPVMHACGHDIHMSCLVGAARVLAATKDQWSGTLMLIAQPAEEIGTGARAMIEDDLFKRFPKPDYAIALHADGMEKAGTIRYTEGVAMANVDSVDVLVRGVGGHGASPHTAVDPIVLAAKIIMDLQTIVSREIKPTDSAVVTVGSIHGGSKHNIIPSEVKLQITVRSFDDGVRDHVLKAIERHCKAAALGARAPEPVIKVHLDEYTPATVNDPTLTKRVTKVCGQVLGVENIKPRQAIMGGEDFGRFGREGIPICMFFLGTIGEERFAQAATKPLPSMHSDGYAPVSGPSLRAGVKALTASAIDLLPKP